MDKVIEGVKALGVWQKVALVAGAVLFIDGFLPWYSVDVGFASISRNGWQSPGAIWSVLAILVGAATAGVILLKNCTDVAIPENVGGLSWPRIFFSAGVAALAFVLIKALNESSFLAYGFYLGIIAAAALALAGFWMYREEKQGQPPLQPL